MTRRSTADAGISDPLDVLEQRIGHRFVDRRLLRAALTHRSAGGDNWERLEFLGDAVLGFLVARQLFDAQGEASEQQLTLMRSNLVRKSSLAEVAGELGLDQFIVLGSAERKSGVARHSSILADALEAVLGAVTWDGGVEAASAVVGRLFGDRLTAAEAMSKKDPKTRLQEVVQARHLALPGYAVVATTGERHSPVYRVECRVDGLALRAEGCGRSVRDAEKQAAAGVLALLDSDD